MIIRLIHLSFPYEAKRIRAFHFCEAVCASAKLSFSLSILSEDF